MLKLKVTRISDRWHARLYRDDNIIDEMACNLQCDIGYICREMLRWYDKLGEIDDFAAAARRRQLCSPVGRIWYKHQLAK